MIVEPDRRDFMRLSVTTQATVTRLSTRERTLVEVFDLSASGCGFNSGLNFQVDEQVEFLLETPSPKLESFRRLATIASVVPTVKVGNRVGIVFLDPPPP